jgi:predicted Zn-dependent protease
VAEGLPDLGESAQADFRRRWNGASANRSCSKSAAIRPGWTTPKSTSYLNRLGNRLVLAKHRIAAGIRVLRAARPTLNAFAMPGGYIGVHTGLILPRQSESELASVLAHEISHVTQRHLARLINKSGQGQVSQPAGAGRGDTRRAQQPRSGGGRGHGRAGRRRSRTSSITRAISSARPIASASACWSAPASTFAA